MGFVRLSALLTRAPSLPILPSTGSSPAQVSIPPQATTTSLEGFSILYPALSVLLFIALILITACIFKQLRKHPPQPQSHHQAWHHRSSASSLENGMVEKAHRVVDRAKHASWNTKGEYFGAVRAKSESHQRYKDEPRKMDTKSREETSIGRVGQGDSRVRSSGIVPRDVYLWVFVTVKRLEAKRNLNDRALACFGYWTLALKFGYRQRKRDDSCMILFACRISRKRNF